MWGFAAFLFVFIFLSLTFELWFGQNRTLEFWFFWVINKLIRRLYFFWIKNTCITQQQEVFLVKFKDFTWKISKNLNVGLQLMIIISNKADMLIFSQLTIGLKTEKSQKVVKNIRHKLMPSVTSFCLTNIFNPKILSPKWHREKHYCCYTHKYDSRKFTTQCNSAENIFWICFNHIWRKKKGFFGLNENCFYSICR